MSKNLNTTGYQTINISCNIDKPHWRVDSLFISYTSRMRIKKPEDQPKNCRLSCQPYTNLFMLVHNTEVKHKLKL